MLPLLLLSRSVFRWTSRQVSVTCALMERASPLREDNCANSQQRLLLFLGVLYASNALSLIVDVKMPLRQAISDGESHRAEISARSKAWTLQLAMSVVDAIRAHLSLSCSHQLSASVIQSILGSNAFSGEQTRHFWKIRELLGGGYTAMSIGYCLAMFLAHESGKTRHFRLALGVVQGGGGGSFETPSCSLSLKSLSGCCSFERSLVSGEYFA